MTFSEWMKDKIPEGTVMEDVVNGQFFMQLVKDAWSDGYDQGQQDEYNAIKQHME